MQHVQCAWKMPNASNSRCCDIIRCAKVHVERIDIIYYYAEGGRNANVAVQLYAQRFPMRICPDASTVCRLIRHWEGKRIINFNDTYQTTANCNRPCFTRTYPGTRNKSSGVFLKHCTGYWSQQVISVTCATQTRLSPTHTMFIKPWRCVISKHAASMATIL